MRQQDILLHAEGLEFLGLLVVFKIEARITAALKPLQSSVISATNLGLQLRVGCTDFGNGMVGCETVLLKSLIDGFLLLLQLTNVFNCTL